MWQGSVTLHYVTLGYCITYIRLGRVGLVRAGLAGVGIVESGFDRAALN